MIRSPEAEGGRSNEVVYFVNRSGAQLFRVVASGSGEPLAHARQKPPLVKAIVKVAEPARTCRKIDRSRNCAKSGDEIRLTEFSGQFERYVSAERESDEIY